MGRWLKALDKALVIRRTRKNASTFYLSSKGVEYFQKMYKETIVIQKQEVYTAEQKPVVSTDTEQPEGGKVNKLEEKIDDLQKDMKFLISMMTPAQQEEAKSHMKLVAKNGELVK